ncbi:MAG: ADP-glyceromanno-heptose 6-epimerase [Bacteroidota bacterium]|nr:ADP-glyceromanno-heptose 6-epimerase [Bacteroidota bacterium]
MIVITGAAGFIGSCLIQKLNQENFNAIIAVDEFQNQKASYLEKYKNLQGKNIQEFVERDSFLSWLDNNCELVEFIFHLGARTDTTEFDEQLLTRLNTNYSKEIWNKCVKHQIPLVYASSAATYGLGEFGYNDDEGIIPKLKPLNPYGESKNNFDKWVLEQHDNPFYWAGLKFFNVYGPNEYHKGRMASVVFHAYNQISQNGKMKLFRSHISEVLDGEQQRDFIYVQDVVDVCYFLMHHRKDSGIYNLGSGNARTFLDLAKGVFKALDVPEKIEFIDTPQDIREKYQYFTVANMEKLISIGYTKDFTNLEDGIKDYVQSYLSYNRYL